MGTQRGSFHRNWGGIRDVAEVTQSDLKAPDVVPITTFHGSLDFNLFYLLCPYFLFHFHYLFILALSILLVSYVILIFIQTGNTHWILFTSPSHAEPRRYKPRSGAGEITKEKEKRKKKKKLERTN